MWSGEYGVWSVKRGVEMDGNERKKWMEMKGK